jgi:hypothetical protein
MTEHQLVLTTKQRVYLLGILCVAGVIYFCPFLYSSEVWAANRQFLYEGRTPVKLPFRWISGEGGGLELRKPKASIALFDSSLNISDNGVHKISEDQRSSYLGQMGIHDAAGEHDARVEPFASAGFICGRAGVSASSGVEYFLCFSADLRYSIQYLGSRQDVQEASEIARQVVR